MERVRKVVSFDRNWLSKVEPGVPFILVNSKDETPVSKPSGIDKKKKDYFSVRTLKSLGELLTIKEAAGILKVTDRAIYEWVYDKRLKSLKVGRHIRISVSDLEEFISA